MVTYLSRKIFPRQAQYISLCQEHAYENLGRYAMLLINFDIHADLPRKFPISARPFPFKNKAGELVHQPIYYRWKPPLKK